MRRSLSVLAILLSFGCSSSFETETPDKRKVEGIPYYQPQLVKITYEYRQLLDKEGKVVPPSAADKLPCAPVIQKEEITALPDYSNRYWLINKPGHFSSGKLSVTLSNGLLTNLNSESIPQLPQLLTAVEQTATQALLRADVGPPTIPTSPLHFVPCNSGAVISRIERIEIK